MYVLQIVDNSEICYFNSLNRGEGYLQMSFEVQNMPPYNQLNDVITQMTQMYAISLMIFLS